MKFKLDIKSICVYSVIILLTIALSVSFFVIGNKNKAIEENKSQITEITKQLDDAKNQIAEKDKANGELSQKLQQAETEKNNLQKENNNLKTEIAKLNAKKLVEAEKLTALQNSPQSTYPPATKVCYLTFDDGPSDNTLKILDILDRYNAKATFFVIGTTGKLSYVKQIHARGHVVGLHTDTHQIYTKDRNVNIYASPEAYFRDLNAISNKVEQLIGIKSKIIRFPGGSSNAVSKKVCAGIMTTLTRQVKAKGYAYFDWNVSSGDASGSNVPASRIVNNVLNASKNKDSICVLMHDTAAKGTTVQALPAMLEGLASMGYRFEGLTEKTNGYWHPIAN
jgi:peptidoglycan/xylan/chitin deacetylase (PgdA/CDA1 family)